MSAIIREFQFHDTPTMRIITYVMDGRGPCPSQPPKATLKIGSLDLPGHAYYFTKSEGERFARIILEAIKDL